MPARTREKCTHGVTDAHRRKMLGGVSEDSARLTESVPDEDSSRSNLLTSQSKLLENWVQLFLFPLINAAVGDKGEL